MVRYLGSELILNLSSFSPVYVGTYVSSRPYSMHACMHAPFVETFLLSYPPFGGIYM
jgi:hypothetical protein